MTRVEDVSCVEDRKNLRSFGGKIPKKKNSLEDLKAEGKCQSRVWTELILFWIMTNDWLF
jgi:hypothetical protein